MQAPSPVPRSKNPFDDFKTVGETTGVRNQGLGLVWFWLMLGGALVGMICGGLLYWYAIMHYRNRTYRTQADFDNLTGALYLTEDQLTRDIELAMGGGAMAGAMVGAGIYFMALLRRNKD